MCVEKNPQYNSLLKISNSIWKTINSYNFSSSASSPAAMKVKYSLTLSAAELGFASRGKNPSLKELFSLTKLLSFYVIFFVNFSSFSDQFGKPIETRLCCDGFQTLIFYANVLVSFTLPFISVNFVA